MNQQAGTAHVAPLSSLRLSERKESMVEQRMDRSRRKLMRAIGKAIPAALLLRVSQANASDNKASDKMTRRQAEYQDTPSGLYSCGMCSLFERPNACKVVEGEISKDGWCKAFAMAD
jgi:hypothetical protein